MMKKATIYFLTIVFATIAAGCAFWGERMGDRGESRFYEADRERVLAAVREEVEQRGFVVRFSSGREGRLIALSAPRTDSGFREAHQTELDFRIEEGSPGEVEVFLVIREIAERETAHGPLATRTAVRDLAFHRQVLEGVARQLDRAPELRF